MARLIKRDFDPKQPLVARRYFVAAGHHFPIGAPFPWKRLMIDLRRVRLLFEAGKVMHPKEGEKVEPEVVVDEPVDQVLVNALDAQAAAEDAAVDATDPTATVEPEGDADAPASADVEIPTPPVEPPVTSVNDVPDDDLLDDMSMRELRKIGDQLQLPHERSRKAMAEAIREARKG